MLLISKILSGYLRTAVCASTLTLILILIMKNAGHRCWKCTTAPIMLWVMWTGKSHPSMNARWNLLPFQYMFCSLRSNQLFDAIKTWSDVMSYCYADSGSKWHHWHETVALVSGMFLYRGRNKDTSSFLIDLNGLLEISMEDGADLDKGNRCNNFFSLSTHIIAHFQVHTFSFCVSSFSIHSLSEDVPFWCLSL